MNKNNKEQEIIKLSDIIDIDGRHIDGNLCSTKHIWNKNGLKDEAKIGLPINFRVIENDINSFSASGIFTKLQLKNAAKHIKDTYPQVEKIHIIDLMKEYHGFIDYGQNAIPFSFRAPHNTVNFGVVYKDVERCEDNIFNKMREKFSDKSIDLISLFSSNQGAVDNIYQTVKLHKYKSILTEHDLTRGENMVYHRLPSIDHSPPSYSGIIDLAKFTQNEFDTKSDWIHIHCHGGKGRSTSFSILFDMFMRLENSTLDSISFTDLLKFHIDSGGINISATPNESWKQDLAVERYHVLNKIYNLLLAVDKYGLKDVYSVALNIFFLHKTNEIDNTTFSSIIRDSGENVQNIVCSDRGLEAKLYSLYLNPDVLEINHCELFNSDSHFHHLHQDFSDFIF